MKTPVRTRLLSALLSLVMLVSLLPVSVFAAEPASGTWEKVTEAQEDWSGQYLIVYEKGSLIMDGSLSALDKEGNKVDVTITDGKIVYLSKEAPKEKPAKGTALGFGNLFTDHMFLMDYTPGQGWHDARIVPYGPLTLDPAASVLHYGQACFEGLKAYRGPDGKVRLFRPDCNGRRMMNSMRRMCMPEIPEEDFVQAIKTLCRVEEAWVPEEEGSSLYFRPLAIATTAKLGVHASGNYLFCVLASPAGTYYPTGMEPVRIYVEPHYIRAAEGGTGFTKCAGNYAGAALAGDRAEKMGFNQVLWLDGHDRKYVEEMGSMNGFFLIGGELYTAAAAEDHGTILPGVTRRSVIELASDWGIPVHEGKLSIDTITEASRNGRLEEVFATGTAAVVIPIKELNYEGVPYYVGDQGIGPLTQKFYDTLTGIQWGQLPDTKGWMVEI